jgi:hypothetical protein
MIRIRDKLGAARKKTKKRGMAKMNKMKKHHNLCDLVNFRLETKRDHINHEPFYNIIKEEDHYFLQKINSKNFSPIEGECDDASMRYAPKKKYGVVVEVKCTDNIKTYDKRMNQLAKNKAYYKQLFKLDKVYCIYAYGDKKDKKGTKLTYEWIPDYVIDKIIVK